MSGSCVKCMELFAPIAMLKLVWPIKAYWVRINVLLVELVEKVGDVSISGFRLIIE